METIKHPKKDRWVELAERPVIPLSDIMPIVKNTLSLVKEKGDEAVLNLTERFDKIKIKNIAVPTNTETNIADELASAIQIAKNNINKFHLSQKEEVRLVETMPGVKCWQKNVPIEKVGLYIPGGTAPLFSSLLMLGVPAKLAGCKEIVVCTPPNKAGKIDDVILHTAKLIGLEKIYMVGGAQAIAAMAYGTETISKVYKIFGPGNQYVTLAKQLVQQEGVAIDMPAGPSELLVIADNESNPEYIAADLLSQAEHGPDSQVILDSNNVEVIQKVKKNIAIQLEKLPRRKVAKKALSNSKAVLIDTIDTAIEFSNFYAPEHLIICTKNATEFVDKIVNAGSVFIGNYSCESAGDYASGTNHTLPTNGFAKSYSGVSLDSFTKTITFQEINKEGIKAIGPAIEQMAAAEQLQAHKNAVSVRLKDLNNV